LRRTLSRKRRSRMVIIMGMDLKITFPSERLPAWPQIRAHLAAHGVPVELRMIDGELAFPDEEPPATWRELRVGTAGGMVTLRRGADGVTLVVWGNADPALLASWNALAQALATLTNGRVEKAP
jgi:hypothetical protein